MREVIHYERREQNLTACRLCPKLCSIREGKYGFCGVRQNRGGTLFATNYGKVSSCALDPIEKKRCAHPSFRILSSVLQAATCAAFWELGIQSDPPTRYPRRKRTGRLQREGYPNTGIATPTTSP